MASLRLKKGDLVLVATGKDEGKRGKILRAWPRERRVLVEGVNLRKKRVRPRRQGEKGQTIELAAPLAAANVMLICPTCGQPTRVGAKIEGGRKLRRCKKCDRTF